ncbi:MAG TPA: hypothetical protein VGK81_05740, partial [Anaerolineae bacterium]
MKRTTVITFALVGAGVLLGVIILLLKVVVPSAIAVTSTAPAAGARNEGSASAGSQASTSNTGADQNIQVTSVPIKANTGGEVSTSAGRAVHGILSDRPPVLDAQTLALQQSNANEHDQQPDPLTPVDKNPLLKTIQPETNPVAAPQQTLVFTNQAGTNAVAAPSDFLIFESKDFGGGASLIGEASHASDSLAVLETYNWGAGLSVDGGRTFRYLNPYSMFPNS